MKHQKYNWFNQKNREKLESLLNNCSQIVKQSLKFDKNGNHSRQFTILVNCSKLSSLLGFHPKTIKREIMRGLVDVAKTGKLRHKWVYSANASLARQERLQKKRNFNQIKLYKNDLIYKFIIQNKGKQSLKAIANRLNLEQGKHILCFKTLYNYVYNKRIEEINKSFLLFRYYKKYKYYNKSWKRQNGDSIDIRPEIINSRQEFGHFELDLIESKCRSAYIMTMVERQTRYLIAKLIPNKKAETIVNALQELQKTNVLVYGKNIKSITTDNGSEFQSWKIFNKSLNNDHKIAVYFCHPYRSGEKGTIENTNRLVRRYFAKKLNFRCISQHQLNQHTDYINNIYRECLKYHSAKEAYEKNIKLIGLI